MIKVWLLIISHILIVVSLLPEAKLFPLGLKTIELIDLECPVSVVIRA